MINLNEWIRRYAKKPIIRLVAFSLCVIAVYFSYLVHNRYSEQLARIEQARETISLGVQQSNRALIEAAMISILSDSSSSFAVLCSGEKASISYPPSGDVYCANSSRNYLIWSVRRPLIGVQDFDVVVVFSPFKAFIPLFFLLFITMFMPQLSG